MIPCACSLRSTQCAALIALAAAAGIVRIEPAQAQAAPARNVKPETAQAAVTAPVAPPQFHEIAGCVVGPWLRIWVARVVLTSSDTAFDTSDEARSHPQPGAIKCPKVTEQLPNPLSADTFADDANSAQRYVPAYAVWDLPAEYKVNRTPLRVIAGVNNLFDEDYYSRVRPDGIDPAPRRNYYLGAALEF